MVYMKFESGDEDENKLFLITFFFLPFVSSYMKIDMFMFHIRQKQNW